MLPDLYFIPHILCCRLYQVDDLYRICQLKRLVQFIRCHADRSGVCACRGILRDSDLHPCELHVICLDIFCSAFINDIRVLLSFARSISSFLRSDFFQPFDINIVFGERLSVLCLKVRRRHLHVVHVLICCNHDLGVELIRLPSGPGECASAAAFERIIILSHIQELLISHICVHHCQRRIHCDLC